MTSNRQKKAQKNWSISRHYSRKTDHIAKNRVKTQKDKQKRQPITLASKARGRTPAVLPVMTWPVSNDADLDSTDERDRIKDSKGFKERVKRLLKVKWW